jgi:hypothetical protein
MFTKRPSDQTWIKYLLNSGLLAVDQLEKIRAGQNQVELGELLVQHAGESDSEMWLNQALQQDRFHYIPLSQLEESELRQLGEMLPILVRRCLSEGILPLGYSSQTIYLGLLRYDPEFPELNAILQEIPPTLRVCLIPLTPADYHRLQHQVRSFVSL